MPRWIFLDGCWVEKNEVVRERKREINDSGGKTDGGVSPVLVEVLMDTAVTSLSLSLCLCVCVRTRVRVCVCVRKMYLNISVRLKFETFHFHSLTLSISVFLSC